MSGESDKPSAWAVQYPGQSIWGLYRTEAEARDILAYNIKLGQVDGQIREWDIHPLYRQPIQSPGELAGSARLMPLSNYLTLANLKFIV